MDALTSSLETLGIFVSGLALRLGFFLALLAGLVVLLTPMAYAFEGVRRVARQTIGAVVHGLEWRRRPRYTPAHLWLRERVGAVRLGLDDLAARLLGRADGVELPPAGTRVLKGEPVARFVAGDLLVTLPSPIDGTVRGVNRRLFAETALATEHPYGAGWLLDLLPSDRECDSFPRHEVSRQWFDREAARFTLAVEHAAGVAAADGGEPIVPERLLLSDDAFATLAKEFLEAEVTTRAASVWD